MSKLGRSIFAMVLAGVMPLAGHAAQQAGEELLEAVRKGDAAGVRTALAKGVDVNTKYRYNRTALSFACDRGNTEIVKVLLEAGADTSVRDSFYGMTAMTAALSKSHVEVVKLLLEKGAANSEGVLMAGVNQGNAELVKASLAQGGLRPDTLTVALVRATRENRAEIAELLKGAGAAPPIALDAAALDEFAGTYRPENGPDVILANREGQLVGGPAGQTLPFVALEKGRFRSERSENMSLTFQMESEKVVGFVLRMGSNETLHKKVEAKP